MKMPKTWQAYWKVDDQNLVRALGSSETRGKASQFLLKVVGSPAVPYLRRAAKSDPSPEVRRQSTQVLRRLERKR